MFVAYVLALYGVQLQQEMQASARTMLNAAKADGL